MKITKHLTKAFNKEEYETTPEQREHDDSDRWHDQLEAIRYTTKVHEALKKELGTDLVMASLRTDQREFIINQVKHAIALQKQIPDAEIGNRIFMTMIAEVLMTAILHRNVEKNTLIEIIGGVHGKQEEPMYEEQDSMLSRMKGRMNSMMNKGQPGPEGGG